MVPFGIGEPGKAKLKIAPGNMPARAGKPVYQGTQPAAQPQQNRIRQLYQQPQYRQPPPQQPKPGVQKLPAEAIFFHTLPARFLFSKHLPSLRKNLQTRTLAAIRLVFCHGINHALNRFTGTGYPSATTRLPPQRQHADPDYTGAAEQRPDSTG